MASEAAQSTALVRRVVRRETSLEPRLERLLADAVENGASIGFLSPLTEDRARAYWHRVFEELGDHLVLWVAEAEGETVGTVQLSLCAKENGRHRAEVQKLFVATSWRGRGVAKKLLAAAEDFARGAARPLLVLDTQAGSDAEHLYRGLGWERAGEIPDYATTPRGELHPTVYYYKRLRA
jgi:GNAT superfamily N-acetyltransferase